MNIKKIKIVSIVSLVLFSSLAMTFFSQAAQTLKLNAYVDGVSQIGSGCGPYMTLKGWAYYDYNGTTKSPIVYISEYADFELAQAYPVDTSMSRTDVQNSFSLTTNEVGFNWIVPPKFYDNQEHTLYVFIDDIDQSATTQGPAYHLDKQLIGTVTFTGLDSGTQGAFDHIEVVENNDGSKTSYVVGWAVDFDGKDLFEEKLPILVYSDDYLIGSGVADSKRTDVGDYFEECQIGSYHGFKIELKIPDNYINTDSKFISVYTVNQTERKLEWLGGREAYYYSDGYLLDVEDYFVADDMEY